MQVCSDGHDEIVFDNSAYRAVCPACKLIKEAEGLDTKIEDLEGEVEELKEEIARREFMEALK